MNRTSRIFLLAAFFTAASLAPRARAAVATDSPEDTQSKAAAQDEALYAEGNRAMNEQRWSDAVTAFDRAAAAKGKREDASLYWKAYSLNKLGRKDEARATCNILRREQPSSTWNKECVFLRAGQVTDATTLLALSKADSLQDLDLTNLKLELRQLDGERWRTFSAVDGKGFYTNRPTTEDDIKILALNSLMRQDPAKALPLLRNLLKSDKPVEMRRQALFVLSRSKDAEAQTILTEAATSKGDPELQREAIEMLAMNRGKDAGPTLVEVYHGATDAGVKRACINGLFLAHDAPRLVELARGEKDLNLKRDIVSQLALMKDQAATDYMLELLK